MAKTLDEMAAESFGALHLTILRLQAENAALTERAATLEDKLAAMETYAKATLAGKPALDEVA